MNIEDRKWFATNFQKFFKLGLWAEVWVNKWVHAKIIFETFKWSIYLIDPWSKQDNWDSDINERNYNTVYKKCLKNTKNCKKIIIRKRSDEGAVLISDNSLDWVYIDAQHSYNWCLEDINLWFPKVRKWWLVSWHDYYNAKRWDIIWNTENRYVEDFNVEDAVNDYAKENGYKVNVTKKDHTWWFIK